MHAISVCLHFEILRLIWGTFKKLWVRCTVIINWFDWTSTVGEGVSRNSSYVIGAHYFAWWPFLNVFDKVFSLLHLLFCCSSSQVLDHIWARTGPFINLLLNLCLELWWRHSTGEELLMLVNVIKCELTGWLHRSGTLLWILMGRSENIFLVEMHSSCSFGRTVGIHWKYEWAILINAL